MPGSPYALLHGIAQPVSGPALSRTPARVSGPAPRPGQHTQEVLSAYGIPRPRTEALSAAGVVV
ncbi:L-carnitine dehydratase/bile acid-inducible protein F [Actinobacteria bacterium OK074]|nr:L-carnitine dehydratase/bile acid-inducible protein F [Actinobacteria bacterium OK074]